ncbi:GNAT family N-acetyltransferase [Halosegnis sp.]|uniref:GNAT family N-acetyltransferase n=1 Tax=Halosegnis sp. TaxID=2864959 RepID=UPI0035D4F20E
MSHGLFPERIETERLALSQLTTADTTALYDLSRTDGWQTATAENMPWFDFDHAGAVREFLAACESDWADAETAAYGIRPLAGEPAAGDLIGLTRFNPEWDRDRAGAGVVITEPQQGRGYGTERAEALLELAFDRLGLGAWVSTHAAGNDASRQMVESYVVANGGQCDGLLRHENPRPDGRMTDQYRYSLLREEWADPEE